MEKKYFSKGDFAGLYIYHANNKSTYTFFLQPTLFFNSASVLLNFLMNCALNVA